MGVRIDNNIYSSVEVNALQDDRVIGARDRLRGAEDMGKQKNNVQFAKLALEKTTLGGRNFGALHLSTTLWY